jgi:hypothetical protein
MSLTTFKNVLIVKLLDEIQGCRFLQKLEEEIWFTYLKALSSISYRFSMRKKKVLGGCTPPSNWRVKG